MNISLNKTDELNGTITVIIEPADYTDKVAKEIKNFSKKANMPGFRVGKVPASLIKKQYGNQILGEVVDKMLQESISNYIQTEKIEMLGDPIPNKELTQAEIVDGNTFTIAFDIAIAPKFEVELSKDDKVAYYNVEVSDDLVNKQVEMYRQRGGSYDKVDSYEDNDMLKGIITELDENNQAKTDGVKAEGVVMLPKYFKDEDQKKLFASAKVNDVITFNPSKAYNSSEAELASLLKVERDKAVEYRGDFSFEIQEITRFVPGPLNQELFDNVFGKDVVKSEDEFKAKIKGEIEGQFKKDSDYKFLLDVRTYITEKVGTLQFPEERLKKIMLAHVNGDQEKVDANYDKNIEELTWHLIKEKLIEKTGVKVENDDVLEMAREVTRMQFAQYGMISIPEEYIESSVKEMLKNRETVNNLVDRAIEVKLGAAVKDIVTLEEQTISPEDFNKMFEA